MKFLLAFILIGSVLAVAGLGAAFMGSRHGAGDHGGCLANLASRAACPNGETATIFAVFHLNIFKTFSAAYLLAIVFLVIAFVVWAVKRADPNHSAYFRQYFFATADACPLREEFISWLKLHEKRGDTVSII
ncbi:MAG: hypothetical protein U1C57_00330 [Candidatus Doudnabacteria bacterium]|nr:hypothetical protein [bacterium]MDZ4243537.1 hypothetical protein [Candidatus Doudnabacteria bacterium]